MRVINIKRSDLDFVRGKGEGSYPNECCGFLVGRADEEGVKRVSRVLPVDNAREEEAQRNRFLIRPEDFIATEKTARADGLDIIGFYHSHPDAEAQPSAFDLEHAWPWYSYLIVSVRDRKAGRAASWVLDHDRSGFMEEDINIED